MYDGYDLKRVYYIKNVTHIASCNNKCFKQLYYLLQELLIVQNLKHLNKNNFIFK